MGLQVSAPGARSADRWEPSWARSAASSWASQAWDVGVAGGIGFMVKVFGV